MKKIKVKAIKTVNVEMEITVPESEAYKYLNLDGKTRVHFVTYEPYFLLMEGLFEDEWETVVYDQIEVTEL